MTITEETRRESNPENGKTNRRKKILERIQAVWRTDREGMR